MAPGRNPQDRRRDYAPSSGSAKGQGEIEILGAEPSQLLANCVVPQALDDQWVPRNLLASMLRSGKALPEIDDVRLRFIRNEYIRALLTARQVVVNRTYLFRNPVINADYVGPGVNRDAFEWLVHQRAIVPFLLREKSPLAVKDAADARFGAAARAWNNICRQQTVYCVRLSWDDTKNIDLVERSLFQEFAAGVRRAADVDVGQLLGQESAQAVHGSRGLEEALRSRLAELQLIRHTAQPVPLTRTLLYEHFVLARNTRVMEGQYDSGKPFVAAVKAFLDLLYNLNLAEALNRALVTPVDTIHASSLSSRPRAGSLLKRVTPTLMEVVQNALFAWTEPRDAAQTFSSLTLADVVSIRQSTVWESYARALDYLLENPHVASHPERGIPGVYKKYRQLTSSCL